MNVADYSVWRARLAGKEAPLPSREACCGFWRKQDRDGSWVPVAIWRSQVGSLVAMVGNKMAIADDEFAERVFAYASKHPVSHETYEAVMKGAPWPDVDAVVHDGKNSTESDDAEALRDQIAAVVEQAKQYANVADDETAAKAQSLRSRILELAGEVKARHKTEKEPHLTAGREIDARWLPLARDADTAAGAIRVALSRHETEKAKAAAKLAQQAKPQAPVEPPKPAQIKGGYGRAASVKTVRVAVIADQDAVYALFRDNADVKALLLKLAQKAVDAGASPNGVKIEEERRVA